jgi:uncharacterized protein (TIGR02145 family)
MKKYRIAAIYACILIFSIGCKKDESQTIQIPDKIFNPDLIYGLITDIDGNIYKTITIGSQTWMAENLKVTHYRNGDPIPMIKDYNTWINLTSGAYSNYYNDTVYSVVYGRLYNWRTISDTRNIAPEGWHVSTVNEWTILIDYLGGDSIAKGKLMEIGTDHWKSPNIIGTNESGFTAIPGGARADFGTIDFEMMNVTAQWWTSLEYNSSLSWSFFLHQYLMAKGKYAKCSGFSIRCVKD